MRKIIVGAQVSMDGHAGARGPTFQTKGFRSAAGVMP